MSQDSDVSPEQFYSVDASQTNKLGADPLQKLRGIHAVSSSVLTSPQMAEPQVTHGDPW